MAKSKKTTTVYRSGMSHSDATALVSKLRDRVSGGLDELDAEKSQREYQQYRQQQALQDIASPDMTLDSRAEYARYKNTTQARLDDYDLVADEVKEKISNLNDMQKTGNVGFIRKTDDGSGLFGYTIDPGWKVDEAKKDLAENYGVDNDTIKAVTETGVTAGKRDRANAVKGEGYWEKTHQEDAEKNWTRTYPEEIEYATSKFTDATDNTDELRKDIASYNSTASQRAQDYFTRPTIIESIKALAGDENSSALKQQIMDKYGLTEDEFDDLAYYGKELDDYDARAEQQEKARANVNTGSTSGDIKGGLANSAIALTTNPVAGINGVAETGKYYLGRLAGTARDQHSPLNVNSAAFEASNATSDLSSATQERINKESKAAGILYNAAMSSAESLETGWMGPAGKVAGLAPFGANAFASALSENVSSGEEMDDAMTDALTTMGIEVGTELLPYDNFWEIAQGNSRTARKVLANFIAQSSIEGAEEMSGDVLDLIIDNVRNGDQSDFNQAVRSYMDNNYTEEEATSLARRDWILQCIEDGITGALSGAMGGAGATALSLYNTSANANEMFSDFTQQDYADFAEGLNTDEETYVNKSAAKSAQEAKTLAEKYSKQETVTNKEKRALYSAYADAVETESRAEQEQREEEQNAAVRAEKNAPKEAQAYTGVEENTGDAFIPYADPNSAEAVRDKAARHEEAERRAQEDRTFTENIPEDLKVASNDYTGEQIHKRMTKAANISDLESVVLDGMTSSNAQTREQTAESLNNLTSMLNSKNISMEEIDSLRHSDADYIRAGYNGEEIGTFTNRQKQLYNIGQQQAIQARTEVNNQQRKIVDTKVAALNNDAVKAVYEGGYELGSNGRAYTDFADTMLAGARNGLSLEESVKRAQQHMEVVGGNTDVLNATAQKLYEVGRQQANTELAHEVAVSMGLRQSVQKFGQGTYVDNRTDTSAVIPGENAVKVIAKATGLDIVVYDKGTKGITADQHETNGFFMPSNSTIYLNAEHAGEFAGTLFHEIGEFTSVYSPEEYLKFSKALHTVMQNAIGTKAYNEMRESYWASYSGEDGKTELDLDKEITNDMLYQIIGTEDGMQKLLKAIESQNTVEEANTIKEKLSNWLRDLATSIKEFFTGFEANPYQKKIANAQAAHLEELADMLNDSIASAVANYRQAQLASLAEVLGVNENTETAVAEVETVQDAYQIAYNNFANAVDDISVAEADNIKAGNKISDEALTTLIDTAKAFNLASSEMDARDIEAVQDIVLDAIDDLVPDDAQHRKARNAVDVSTEIYHGAGYEKIPYNEENPLKDYVYRGLSGSKLQRRWAKRNGKRATNMETPATKAMFNLTGTINRFEQKYGLDDSTVKGLIRDAKRAVNNIEQAIEEGRAGVDSKDGVVAIAGENYAQAMSELKDYAKDNIKGFDPMDINAVSYNAAIDHLCNFMAAREYVNTDLLESSPEHDEVIDWLIANEKNQYAVPVIRKSVKVSADAADNVKNHDYSYTTLTNKGDLPIHNPTDFSFEQFSRTEAGNRGRLKKLAASNLRAYNQATDKGDYSDRAYNRDLGAWVYSPGSSFKHGPKTFSSLDANAYANFAAYFENAIVVNELDSRTGNEDDMSYVLVGAYKMDDGIHVARIIVNHLEEGVNQVEECYEKVYSILGEYKKKEPAQSAIGQSGKSSYASVPSEISIAQLLAYVQDWYPNELSQDVAEHLGYSRGESDLEGVRYSRVIHDTSGHELSAGQQEYFKDSKAVDEDGRLKVMYHGTHSYGFTVFDPGRSQGALFFSDNAYVADSYGGDKYSVYLDLKNPLEVDYGGGYYDESIRYDDESRNVYNDFNNALKDAGIGYNADGILARWIRSCSSAAEDAYEELRKNHNKDFADFYEGVSIRDVVDAELVSKDVSAKLKDKIQRGADMLDAYVYEIDFKPYLDRGADYMLQNLKDKIESDEIAMDTRDWARYAQQHGYDGVIFRNINDMGNYEFEPEESTVMVAFDSNQVKSVDNENPTADVDIRRSMDLEDNRNMNNEGISQNREEIAGILEKGAEALKGTKVNKQAIQNIAMEMKRQYSSAIDLDTFTDNLTKLFGYLHSGKSINYNDFVAVMQDVARPAIDAAYTSQASREDFAQFRNAIDGMEFSLSMEQRKAISGAFGSMKTFQRYYPEIHINSEAQSIQEQWSSLVDLSRGLLDENTEAADMPTALVDAMEALRPSMNTWSDNTQAAHDMALDIIAKYLGNYHDSGANKAVINEFTKTAQKQIKASQKGWKDKLKAEYNERLKVERAYQKELAAGRVAKANERSAEQIAKLKAKNATRIADIRERQKRNNQLQQINKSAGTLYQYLTSPTDQNHIPKDLQEPVLQLMASLDMSQPNIRQGEDGKWHTKILAGRTLDEASGRYAYEWQDITADTREDAIRQYNDALANGLGSAGARKWYDRMQDMADLYRKQKGGEVYADGNSQDMAEFIQGLDEELADEFDKILKDGRRDGKASMADLDSEDLKVVNKVLRNVLHAVNGINRSYSMPSETITEIAGEVMDKADRVNGRRNHNRNVEGTINFMMLSNATPETYMHGIGADKVTDIMIAAQNQKAWRIREANEYSENLFKGLKGDIRTWDKPQQYMGGKVTATKAQIMTIYELLKRPDAREHLLYGGFKVGAIGNKTNTQSRVVHLTEEQYYDLINEALTDKDKAVADGMQRFMAVNCSAWGNETSVALYGYDKFLDEKYWPMTVDKTSVDTRTGEMMGGVANTIKNMGMTKATVSGANNALVINGALDVYAKHISDMAVYSSWAAPMQDMVRFFNYKEVAETEEGFVERRSTKEAIERMFGTGGTDYFKKLVASIQGSEQSSYEDPGFVTRMTSAAKKAAVLGNIRVMVQQPTAIFRAAKMIDNKYLIMGSAYKMAQEAAELRDRTSATFWLKNQGNIDGQITQSFKSQVTGVQGFNDWFSEWTGKPAGFADKITWAAMYRAVYAEQVDKLGKDKIGTKEFEDAVNSRFDHIMLRTQVYDGTITRSQFMRSTDKMNQLQSAFMAEPVKTYNVILRDVIDWQQSKKGSQERKDATIALAKSTRVLLVTAAANAFMQSVWDAFRNAGDPDEEDEFWARVKAALLGWDGNLVDNIEPWNNIPVIGDYTETAIAGVQQIVSGKSQWTSSSDLSTSGISHLIDAGTAMVKYWRAMTDPEARDSNTQTAYGVLAKVIRAASDIFGIPAYAIQRDTVAIYNVLARNTLPFISGGAIDDLPLLYKSKTSDKAQTKSDAYETIRTSTDLDEVKAAIDEAASHSNSYKSINSDMKEKLKDDLVAAYNRSPSEATQMINRIAEVKAYCSDKEGTLADKSHSKKVEYYKKQVKEWLE